MASKTSCTSSGNRTRLVDPNTFDGQSSSSNISVPLEDLSIMVELSTTKKARTILTTSKEGKSNVSSTGKAVRINFIEGSEVGGKKSLTTKYTDLTTVFDGPNHGENLGITSIDIDFNSSNAPMITIQFVDVRGSAIFQNEQRVSNSESDYSVFFELPYPLYELTVKGYYGQPVKYCLHMYKFTSRFNSQTGNFEITASFIGYTYAMLSDMLLGYLKAIEYTRLGKDKYKELKDPTKGGDDKLLTLNELYTAISNINENVNRLVSSDESSKQLSKGETKLSQLVDIENKIMFLGQKIDIKQDFERSRYDFIIVEKTTGLAYMPLGISNNNSESIQNYQTDVTEYIDKTYNIDTNFKLTTSNFNNLNADLYSDLSIKKLKELDEETKIKFKDTNTAESTSEAILKYLSYNNYGITSEDKAFDVYDNRVKYKEIDTARNNTNKEFEVLKKELSEKLRESIRTNLGFDPTVKNIVNVFTSAVEVFMYTLFQVSKTADSDTETERINELKKVFKNIDSSDISSNAIAKTSGNASGNLQPKFYPWPDYREERADGLVETYLGKPNVLDNPKKVTELEFIDDLLRAFLIQAVQSENADVILEESTLNWFSVNPLDTRLFVDRFPYKRIDSSKREDVLLLAMLRAMTYLGYTNESLSENEIKELANKEAEALLKDIQDPLILQSMTQLTTNDYLLANGVVKQPNDTTDVKTNVITEIGDKYYYNYIWNTSNVNDPNDTIIQVLPISDHFTGTWSMLNDDLIEESKKTVFLTNYASTKPEDNLGNPILKPDDGGIYIKIIDKETYYGSNAFPLVSSPTSTEITINFENISSRVPVFFKTEDIGFNVVGGTYGTQEFSKMDFGGDLSVQPYMYTFYADSNFDDYVYSKSNGFALKRKVSGEDGTTPTVSDFDIKSGSYKVATDINQIMSYIDYDETTGIDLGLTTNYRLHKDYGKNRKLASLYINSSQDVTYPYINFNVVYPDADDDNYLAPVSLFGSRFYNEQKSDYVKAFLFLHTFPWNGLITDREYAPFTFNVNNTIFDKYEIINTFAHRGGFVSVPLPWVAFIGGLLWRADDSEPIFDTQTGQQIGGGSGSSDPIIFFDTTANESYIPTFGDDLNINHYPNRKEYLTCRQESSQQGKDFPNNPMSFGKYFNFGSVYKRVDDVLLSLPDQAKNEFKKAFFDFVGSNNGSNISEWYKIKSQFEIFDNTTANWKNTWNNIVTNTSNLYQNSDGDYVLNTTVMRNTYKVGTKYNFDNYSVFTLVYDDNTFSADEPNKDFEYNYFLENKDDTQAVKSLMDLYTKETILLNSTYKTWSRRPPIDDTVINSLANAFDPFENNHSESLNRRDPISVKKDDLKLYFDTITSKLNNNKEAMSAESKKKKQELALFGTSDENIIKLQLYRTCKNIYDKWIGGANDGDNVIFQCGNQNAVDKAKASNRNGSNRKLIDSFRFVTRSFKDIGDELAINPLPVADYLKSNPNSSFYDCVTNLLSSNNFLFNALPSFINYRDPNLLESVFKPIPYYEAKTIADDSCGPTFVCVYLGQSSKNLDINNSNYTNDGFDVICKDGSLIGLPIDYSANAKDDEDVVTFFNVTFGQQNQNIFKDIVLDQSEFGETAESLQITDDISKKGAETNASLAGQNIYNVHAVRSYKVEIEMLGDAMIQPMMNFQLNNIPMFHGAYMVTRVKHNIKPNHMSTHFTGVRIRKPETEIFTSGKLYMSLLDSIDTSTIKKETTNNVFGSDAVAATALPPVGWTQDTFVDPFDNNKDVLVSSAPGVRSLDGSVNMHKGVDFVILEGTNLISVYGGTIELLKYDAKGFGLYVVINHGVIGEKTYKSIYGHMSNLDQKTFGKTLSTLSQNDINQIVSGYDPKIRVEKGQIIGKSGGKRGVTFIDKDAKLYDTAGHSTGPHLHYELRIGETSDVNTNVFSLPYVNGIPYLPLNAYTKYEKGARPDTDVVLLGDNADFWSLMSICSLEAGEAQARADVAQSIYNRLATPNKPYGKTIKEIIVAAKQYEPTFNNRSDWFAINDETSAIKAIKNAKGWNDTQAKKALVDTKNALFDKILQSKAKEFVGTRTEFLAEEPTSNSVIGVVQRNPTNINNAFFWAYAGKALKDKTPPPQPVDWNSLNVNTNIV